MKEPRFAQLVMGGNVVADGTVRFDQITQDATTHDLEHALAGAHDSFRAQTFEADFVFGSHVFGKQWRDLVGRIDVSNFPVKMLLGVLLGELLIEMVVADRVTGQRRLLRFAEPLPAYDSFKDTAERLCHLRKCIQAAVAHELDECLLVAGERVFDPHTNRKGHVILGERGRVAELEPNEEFGLFNVVKRCSPPRQSMSSGAWWLVRCICGVELQRGQTMRDYRKRGIWRRLACAGCRKEAGSRTARRDAHHKPKS